MRVKNWLITQMQDQLGLQIGIGITEEPFNEGLLNFEEG